MVLGAATTGWDALPVVRRDVSRFNESCSGTAARLAVASLRAAASLDRVLVVDGRCFCKANGIGNLYGDYMVWFLAAALSGRAQDCAGV